MNTKSINNRIAVSVASITLGLTGMSNLLVPASATAAPLANGQQKTITQLIEAGHCAHDGLLAMEPANLPANGKLATFTKLCKPVGFVAGAVQGVNGAKLLREGNAGEGGAELTGATANTISACAAYAGQAGLCQIAGAAGAGIDGAMDIYDGVESGCQEKVVVGGFKSTASAMLLTSAVQPELAPILVPVGTVTYVGAITADVAYENQDVICETVGNVADTTDEYYESAKSSAMDEASGAVVRSKVVVADVKDVVSSKINDAAETVYQSSQQLKDWLFN